MESKSQKLAICSLWTVCPCFRFNWTQEGLKVELGNLTLVILFVKTIEKLRLCTVLKK